MLASDKSALPSEIVSARSSVCVMVSPPSRCRFADRPRPRPSRAMSTVWMAMAFFTAGCLLRPNFKTPQASIADYWMEKADASLKSDGSENRDWWTGVQRSRADAADRGRIQTKPYRADRGRPRARVSPAPRHGDRRVLPSATASRCDGELQSHPDLVALQLHQEHLLVGSVRPASRLGAGFLGQAAAGHRVRRQRLPGIRRQLRRCTRHAGGRRGERLRQDSHDREADRHRERQRRRVNVPRSRSPVRSSSAERATKRDVYQAENVLGATEAAIPQLRIQLAAGNERAQRVARHASGPSWMTLLAGSSRHPRCPRAGRRRHSGGSAAPPARRPARRAAGRRRSARRSASPRRDLLPALHPGRQRRHARDATSARTRLGRRLHPRAASPTACGPAVQWNILNYGQITNNVRVQDAKLQATADRLSKRGAEGAAGSRERHRGVPSLARHRRSF